MAVMLVARPAPLPLRDVRCAHCHRLLFKAAGLARVEIVCAHRDCRRWQAVRLQDATGPLPQSTS
jgi:phage FluMu protein Com